MRKSATDLDLKAADFHSQPHVPEQLKERLVGWARAIVSRLKDVGIEVEATWSDEQPIARHGKKLAASRVLFHAPLKKHALLALRLDHRRVEVSLEAYPSVHARSNVHDLVDMFAALPEQFVLGRVGGDRDERVPAQIAGEADVRAILDDDGALWLGWSVPRDLALQHAATLGEQLADAIVLLSDPFRVVTGLPFENGPESNRGVRVPIAKRVPLRRTRAAGGDVDSRVAIEKGTRVRVTAGPFEGKSGVVQELDGRGGARVMLGLLAARLAVKDLIAEAEGRGRPVLGSSHRRFTAR